MNSEIKGSVLGANGTYKRIGKVPPTMPPHQHYIMEKGAILKDSMVAVHGKENGSIIFTEMELRE